MYIYNNAKWNGKNRVFDLREKRSVKRVEGV